MITIKNIYTYMFIFFSLSAHLKVTHMVCAPRCRVLCFHLWQWRQFHEYLRKKTLYNHTISLVLAVHQAQFYTFHLFILTTAMAMATARRATNCKQNNQKQHTHKQCNRSPNVKIKLVSCLFFHAVIIE